MRFSTVLSAFYFGSAMAVPALMPRQNLADIISLALQGANGPITSIKDFLGVGASVDDGEFQDFLSSFFDQFDKRSAEPFDEAAVQDAINAVMAELDARGIEKRQLFNGNGGLFNGNGGPFAFLRALLSLLFGFNQAVPTATIIPTVTVIPSSGTVPPTVILPTSTSVPALVSTVFVTLPAVTVTATVPDVSSLLPTNILPTVVLPTPTIPITSLLPTNILPTVILPTPTLPAIIPTLPIDLPSVTLPIVGPIVTGLPSILDPVLTGLPSILDPVLTALPTVVAPIVSDLPIVGPIVTALPTLPIIGGGGLGLGGL